LRFTEHFALLLDVMCARRLPCVRRNFNYSMRLVMLSASLLLLGLHYFACALWLVLRVQVGAESAAQHDAQYSTHTRQHAGWTRQ
jgi:hypothetical protein